MTKDQLDAVEAFAKKYREVIERSSVNKEPMARYVIEYAREVLDIHLQLARIAWELEVNKEAAHHG